LFNAVTVNENGDENRAERKVPTCYVGTARSQTAAVEGVRTEIRYVRIELASHVYRDEQSPRNHNNEAAYQCCFLFNAITVNENGDENGAERKVPTCYVGTAKSQTAAVEARSNRDPLRADRARESRLS
jgi:hypothetical protein